MSRPAVVPSVIEKTDHVEPGQAFDFWRSTALAPYGDVRRAHPRDPFRAKRLVVTTDDWALTHTVSSPVGLRIGARHLDRNAPDRVVIGLAISGVGYQEQCERGAQLKAGDVSFLSRNRPAIAGTQSHYEEIRLALPRETFETWFGPADDFAGRAITGRPTQPEFKAGLQAFAARVSWMTADEARVAVEVVLCQLRTLMAVPGDRSDPDVSREAVVALARAYIIRRLHDPGLGPEQIQAALGLSRAHLYRAFSETEGVAAAIRDARLDLAFHRLTAPVNDGLKIATIAYACGFTDAPTFNRAFRRRFGHAPGDLRAGRARSDRTDDGVSPVFESAPGSAGHRSVMPTGRPAR